jgi:primary-amine oxidase
MVSYAHCWLRLYANENFYAHPIDGLNVAVDVKTGEVLRIDDHGGPPIPMVDIPYDPEFMPPARAPLKPLNVVQPEGTSFTLDGHAIAWDKWTLGIGFSPRDGIILHDIRYGGRPVVRRAALGELVVPYGSPELRQVQPFVEARLRLPWRHSLSRQPLLRTRWQPDHHREGHLHP